MEIKFHHFYRRERKNKEKYLIKARSKDPNLLNKLLKTFFLLRPSVVVKVLDQL